MSDALIERFQKAGEAVKTLAQKPDSDVLLKLYALFKQGSQGECTGDRPGMMDFVGRAKYDAWKGLAGTSKDVAMQRYIDEVSGMLAAEGRTL
jgi:diazepam-binding inhibitor (GABA receptor modulating acyl-CoA-binding protein)